MRSLIILIITGIGFVAFPLPALGQTADSGGWARVKSLQSFTAVIVELRGAKRVSGHMISASDESILLKTKDSEMKIERSSVLRIFRAEFRDEGKAKRRGAIFGLLAGIGLVAIRESIAPSHAQDSSNAILLVAGIGGGVGVATKRAEKAKKGDLIFNSGK